MLSCASALPKSAFVTAVVRSSPMDYFRLESEAEPTGGQSFSSRRRVGDVRRRGSDSKSIRRLGRDGFVAASARWHRARGSIMAWVNLAKTPSRAGHISRVAGDRRAETIRPAIRQDSSSTRRRKQRRFMPQIEALSASGTVATFDTEHHALALWDGRLVATIAIWGPGRSASSRSASTVSRDDSTVASTRSLLSKPSEPRSAKPTPPNPSGDGGAGGTCHANWNDHHHRLSRSRTPAERSPQARGEDRPDVHGAFQTIEWDCQMKGAVLRHGADVGGSVRPGDGSNYTTVKVNGKA